MRASVCLFASGCLFAQTAEPILTKPAIPFGPGGGSLKLDYAGRIGGAGSQAIPAAFLEIGVQPGWEVILKFPLLRVAYPGSVVIGGGQFAAGARHLLAGGADRSYAISVQGIYEAPTGDSQLVGDATQLMAEALAEWHAGRQIVLRSTLTFDRSVAGGPKASLIEYAGAVEWLATARIVPAFEVVSSTDTFTSRTQAAALPEAIARIGPHFAWKAGLQLGLTSATPALGVRAQVEWRWGERR